MRRSICILTTLTLLALTACSVGTDGKVSAEDVLTQPFTCTANVTTEDLTAVGTLTRHGVGDWEVEFSEPATLSGVTLAFDGVYSEASYKGLSFSIPKSAVPINSMLLCLATAVDEVATSEDRECSSSEGFLTFKGSTDCGDYTLTVDESTGDVAMFTMKNLNLTIIFSDVTTLESQSETEASTDGSTVGTTADTSVSST